MTDLHGWIAQRVDATEQRADRWHDIECEIRSTTRDATDTAVMFVVAYGCNGPVNVRLRCEANRKILDEHAAPGFDGNVHCEGCGVDYESGPLVENINDCPTLLALAEGYGLTPELLATLGATPVGRCISSHCVEGDHILDLDEEAP